CGQLGTFARPLLLSGASTGVYDALELRDSRSDYLGKGVSKVVDNVNSIIARALIGKDPTTQTELDNFMVQQLDGTKNEWGWCKQKLGANAILAVSLAHVVDLAGNKQLVLWFLHSMLSMVEFIILPTGAASFKEAMKMGAEVYHNLKENKEGLELLKTAIEKAGYTGKVVIGMDVAASEFYNDKDKTYDLNFKEENNDGSQKISGDTLKNVYKSVVSEYPIVSIEDPFDKDDWVHYAKMTEECVEQVQNVGDDLLVTNPTINGHCSAIKKKSNGVMLVVSPKNNIKQHINAYKTSKTYNIIITFICPIACCLGTWKLYFASLTPLCRSERIGIYTLMRLSNLLGLYKVYEKLVFPKK
ncbi:hypothetical protein ZWY2020_046729, partial [Hordeum vulgare]